MTKPKRAPVVGQINQIEHLHKFLTSAGDDFIAGLHAMEAEALEKETTLAELDRKIRDEARGPSSEAQTGRAIHRGAEREESQNLRMCDAVSQPRAA
jgi:hypothetical protein